VAAEVHWDAANVVEAMAQLAVDRDGGSRWPEAAKAAAALGVRWGWFFGGG
jgi:hypothetical protein